MTSTEAEETYRKLAHLLANVGLQWLVERVEEYIGLGKIEDREVATIADDEGSEPVNFPSRRRPGPKSRYLGSADYSRHEHLILLIDAVLQSVVYVQQMEADASERLNSVRVNPDGKFEVRLVRETRERRVEEVSLRHDIPKELIRELQESLETLWREATG
jgi:hypothetical protein